MKTLKLFTLFVALLAVFGSTAQAQNEAPKKPGAKAAGKQAAGRAGNMMNMPVAALDYMVDLKDDQKTKISEIQNKYKSEMAGAKGDRAKTREIGTKATQEIQSVLTDDQRKDLRKKAPMVSMLVSSQAIPAGALKKLNLTEDQNTKIMTLVKEAQDKIKAAPRGDREARQKIQDEFKTGVMNVLTDDQKKTASQPNADAKKPKKKKTA